jgi:phospholipid N-methyltransferase
MLTAAPITFFRQTLSSFRTTGALAPSSPFLAKAMVEALPPRDQISDDYRVLEVGPGTGAFTTELAKRMGGRGHLELWEINPKFVERLQKRIDEESKFRAQKPRIQLQRGDVRELPGEPTYDAIISGLPFSNFTSEEVREFLEHFRAMLKPGGTLSYFEYAFMRRLQQPFCGSTRRTRLRGVARVVREFSRNYQIDQRIVPINLPPARVRHLQFDGN